MATASRSATWVPTSASWRRLDARQCSAQGEVTLLLSDPQQLPLGRVGEQVEVAVRADAHVADTCLAITQQAFFTHHLITVQLQTNQLAGRQRPDKQAALPAREALMVIERHTTDGR